MSRRVHTSGQNNWHARSGYKRSPSVPGPIKRTERSIAGAIAGGVLLSAVFVVGTLLLVAGG